MLIACHLVQFFKMQDMYMVYKHFHINIVVVWCQLFTVYMLCCL